MTVEPPANGDEAGRLAALHSYDILDTPPEPEFDDIAQMAAQACGTAMAHINFIDADRQWIKAAVGHEAREMTLHLGFCTDTLEKADLLIVPDLSENPELADNPLVSGPPHLRFYAGVPLKSSEGWVIGTLCVLDRVPHELSEQQIFILRALARTVMTQLEMRRTDQALRRSETRLRLALAAAGQGDWELDLWTLDLQASETCRAHFGRTHDERFTYEDLKAGVHPDDRERMQAAVAEAIAGRTDYDIEYRCIRPDGGECWLHMHGRPSYAEDGSPRVMVGISTDVTARRETEAALRASEARLAASEARQAFLLKLTDTIRALTDPHAIMSASVEALGRHLKVPRTGYGRIQPDGHTIVREVGFTDGVQPTTGPQDIEAFGGELLGKLRAGKTIVVTDVASGTTADPSVWQAVGVRAFVGVPLVRDGRLIATLYATENEPRGWTWDDVTLVEDVAARTWDAVERAGAEASKREGATRHRQILDSAIDYAIIATDRDGRVTEWNEGARRILGWDEAEMLDQTAERFFTPEDRAKGQIEAEMRLAAETGIGNDERWHLRKGGERFWASGEMTPLRDEAGAPIGFVKVLRDRTSDQLAREALDEVVQRQEIALDTGRVGFFDWDVDRNVVQGDERYAGFFEMPAKTLADGVPLDTLLGKVQAEDRQAVSDHITAALESLSDYAVEFRVKPAASERWLVARGRCYASADGRPLRYAGTVIDVTHQKTTQSRLHESEERYRSLFDSIDAGFCIIDMIFDADGRPVDYRFVEVNPAFERQTGLTAAVGRTMRDFAPDMEQHWFDTYGQVALTGESKRFENAAEALDGRWYDVYAFRSGEPSACRVAVLFNDVSPRRHLELQLRRLNETLEAQVAERTAERDRVWRNARDLLAIIDRTGVFRAVNPAWETTLGFRSDEILGRNFLDFLAPEDIERSRRAHEVATHESLSNFENRYRHFDGSYRTIAWQTSVEGELVYAYGRDVTVERERHEELTHAQEALRQSQKMEAVGQLTGGVAHDFNNLLTIIRSSVDFLRRPDLPDDRRKRYMDAVSDTVERAAKLTGQLLAFARRQALKPEVFDVGSRLGSVADMLDTVTGARISVVAHVPDHPCFIRADISQFETALVNMAVNARDAMDGEGTLTLRLVCSTPMPALRGHAGARGPFAAVSLHDTGSGIGSEALAHIFEPFFTTKEVGRGTGLGLSQVFGFAKQSGGDVSVESEPGTGTTFTLYLPEIEAPEGGEIVQALESDLSSDGTGRRVLVVEDNIEVGRFATQILQDLGYATAWSANAEEALDTLGSDGAGFDVVFSDVVMPGMGGVALAEELRRRLPDLPVVLASGYSHVLAQEGAHGFELLHKPYSAEQLSRVLRRVSARWRRPRVE
ncbi:PAS domain S-box protein [Methylobacterium sp. WL9]|uniref:PAS domain S-box protein n=1 Tax=Methylobacterium sp. WL9 TaxID=2603898 RepID=UPI0016501F80|nr:PAS domain S-box protein [Methylobacterium sp. WL9]